MEKANETWTNDLCPIESGENTDDAQVSFSIFSDISWITQLHGYTSWQLMKSGLVIYLDDFIQIIIAIIPLLFFLGKCANNT